MTRLRVLLFLVAGTSALGGAQDLASHPWAAWFGCWAPTASESLSRPVTCVVPAAGDAATAEVITGVGGALARQSRIVADGQRVPFDHNGCVGWDAAEFSADGARIYFSGEVTCGNRGTQLTSGVYAFAPGGEWLDVQVIRTGEQRTMRSQRLALLPLEALPADLQEDFAPLERVSMSARAEALASPLNIAQVTEVATRVDAAAAEIWLIEASRGIAPPFKVRRAELRQMAQAQVPERVIDAAVAVANPSHFHVDVAAGESLIAQLVQSAASDGSTRNHFGGGTLGLCGMGVWNDLYFQPTSMFMWMSPSFQYFLPQDRNCLGSAFYGWNWFDRTGGVRQVVFVPSRPVVTTVAPKSPTPRANTGRSGGSVVSGSGYRQPRGSGMSGGSGSGSGASGSARSTGSSGSSGSGGGRTAKPRTP